MVSLPGGFAQALKLTQNDTISRTVSRNGRSITIIDRIANIGWQVKGLGTIRTRTTDTATYSDGLQPDISTDATTLTAASLLLNFALSSAKLSENQPAGTLVGTFVPAAPNPGGTSTYSLLSASSYPDNAAFTIVGNQLLTAKPLNYEAKPSYSLGVRATDAKGASYAKTVIVSIVNVNEAPTAITLSRGWVAENQPAGTLVGLLSGSDPDAGNTLRFSLVDGDGSADNAAFKISGTQLLTTQRFNYDRKSSYSIRLRVADQGGLTHEKAVTIAVAPTLLAARLSGGTLSVHGSAAADHLNLTLAHGVMTASINGHSSTFQAAQVQKVLVYGLSGNDSVNCSTLNIPCTVWGGAGNDTLTGSQADDFLYGGADNDVLYGQQGNNSLDGGAGDDKVYGGSGNDNLSGGTGHNTLSGGGGDDVLYARNGIADTLDGGSGSNSAQVDDLIDNVANIQNPLA